MLRCILTLCVLLERYSSHEMVVGCSTVRVSTQGVGGVGGGAGAGGGVVSR